MFSIAPELQDSQAQVRAFAHRHIAPVAAAIDESAQYDVFAGLTLQRRRLKYEQQVPESQG